MIISVSSMDHLSALEALASCPNIDITLTPANVGDRLDVTFDEKNEDVNKALISILSFEVGGDDDREEDGSRKGRRRWIGDDAVSVDEKAALKILRAGFGRKGISYAGGGRWNVSKDAYAAYNDFQKVKAASAKSKANYRSR